METTFKNLEMCVEDKNEWQVLDENEMKEINGGQHIEWIDGELVIVED